MKNIKYFFGTLFLSLLLIIQISACGGGGGDEVSGPTPGTPFLTSDLAGTWYMFATNGASPGVPPAGSIAAGNLRGRLLLDSLGQVVLGGSFTRSNNQSVSLTGGLIAMDSSGILSGSATTNLGVNFYLGSGKMDSRKDIISFVASTNYGEHDLITAIRLNGGHSALDLAATWYVFSAGGDYGQITVTSASDNIKATIAAPGGGGFFAIDGNGLVNDTFSGTSFVTGHSGTNIFLKQGKINLTNDIICFVAGTDPTNFDLVTAIRAGGTFAAADLSGTWSISGGTSSGTDSTQKATLSGTVTLDAAGNITGGSLTRSEPAGTISFKITGGAVTIDNSGVIIGNANTDAGSTITISSGKMNAAKGMMSLVGNTNAGEHVFLFGLKS